MVFNPDYRSPVAPLRLSTEPTALMTPELREQIASRMRIGEDPEQIGRWLSIKGFSAQVIKEELERVAHLSAFNDIQKMRTRLAKYEWLFANVAGTSELDPAISTVPIEENIEPERFFAHYYAHNRPVLLSGLIDHWAALEKWSLDYLAETLGDMEVSVQLDRESDANYESNSNSHRQQLPFSTLAQRFRDEPESNDYYITANNTEGNAGLLAAIRNDIGDVPGILEPQEGYDGFFWMGPKGTITPWHHDLTNNLLVQVKGRKAVRLVAPYYTPLMRNYHHCYTKWQAGDLKVGPAGNSKPRVIECMLQPGQSLFLPVGWWHCVFGLEQTIGMSFTNFAAPNTHYETYTSNADM